MKKVIVFHGNTPPEIVNVVDSATSITRKSPSGNLIKMDIMSAGFPSLTGEPLLVSVASDRMLSSKEMKRAAEKFL